MSKKTHSELHKENEEDENIAAGFYINAAYALIAGNWALISLNKYPANKFIVLSIIFSMIFLFTRGVRYWLNIAHNHAILDDARKNNNTFVDDGADSTCYGKLSNLLEKTQPIILLVSFLSFFVASFCYATSSLT